MKLVLIFCAAVLARGAHPAPPPIVQGCDGCFGAGGGGSASGGTCGGMVSISVTVSEGRCKWAATDSAFLFYCKQVNGCATSVARTWTDLPPGTPLEFCVDPGVGQLYCLQDPPDAGGGTGGDTRESVTMPCKQGSYTWTITASCGLTATAQGTCSRCEGDI